ncbi:hypothetical protein llap_21603 [Limosa lapponica baueri]|uniref:Fibrinogen C-terminal domain-containing protein n=1 Tax=Limosa lapponica baueri TaxID=1758121 RepID=A0A2I0T2S3_LIMLA|nr:hypothetical protein llap_21603 [Limosa lapponica baueri]
MTREGALLDLLVVNREGLVGHATAGGCLGDSDHEMIRVFDSWRSKEGGWWFDACGPSNLNGMYYPLRQNNNKFNGIKWYYWKGSGYSLKATTMMIRPADF